MARLLSCAHTWRNSSPVDHWGFREAVTSFHEIPFYFSFLLLHSPPKIKRRKADTVILKMFVLRFYLKVPEGTFMEPSDHFTQSLVDSTVRLLKSMFYKTSTISIILRVNAIHFCFNSQ